MQDENIDQDKEENNVSVSAPVEEETPPLNTADTNIQLSNPIEPISWTASEFIAHKKSPTWYLILAVAAVIFGAIVFLLTKDKITAVAVTLAGLMLALGASKKPREVEYLLDNQGITIAGKLNPYIQYRSFSVIRQGAFSSIVIYPLRRFSLLTQVIYDPKDEAKIMEIISNYLPLDEKKRDLLDELMWRIKY